MLRLALTMPGRKTVRGPYVGKKAKKPERKQKAMKKDPKATKKKPKAMKKKKKPKALNEKEKRMRATDRFLMRLMIKNEKQRHRDAFTNHNTDFEIDPYEEMYRDLHAEEPRRRDL